LRELWEAGKVARDTDIQHIWRNFLRNESSQFPKTANGQQRRI